MSRKHYSEDEPFYKKGSFWAILLCVAIIIALGATIAFLVLFKSSDGNNQAGQSNFGTNGSNSGATVTQKTSTDINTAYVKNYVGQNLATACDWSWTNKCLFSLDAGGKRVNLMININASDGRNIEGDEVAKAYKITSQSFPQNTQVSVAWDDDDWTLSPKDMDVTVEPIGTIKEVTKTGEVERYLCASKGDSTGRVVDFLRKNSSSGLQSDSYDIVLCEWHEVVVE